MFTRIFFENRLGVIQKSIKNIILLYEDKINLNLEDNINKLRLNLNTGKLLDIYQKVLTVSHEQEKLKRELNNKFYLKISLTTFLLLKNTTYRSQENLPDLLEKYKHLVNKLSYYRSYRKLTKDISLKLLEFFILLNSLPFSLILMITRVVPFKESFTMILLIREILHKFINSNKVTKETSPYYFFNRVKSQKLEHAMHELISLFSDQEIVNEEVLQRLSRNECRH